MSEPKDYYEILQVSQKATPEEIKAAFRRLARQYHPDLNPNNEVSLEKFREICEAYEVLSGLDRRQYDRETSNQPSDRDFYVRGVEKALEKNYPEAVKSLDRAIELNSRFFEAYLKRCEVRYKLGDNRGVLEDCRQLLQIDPQCAQAYYYQGRSRLRLGYAKSAIEAYTEAIRLENRFAQAYYYRGLAYQELADSSAAVKDLQTAAQLFRMQGDSSGYQLATDTLKNLNRGRGAGIAGMKTMLENAFKAFQTFIIDPGGVLPAYARMEREQAAAVGILYGIITILSFLGSTYIGLQLGQFPFIGLSLVATIPFVGFAVTSALARFIFRRQGSFAGDLFLAGASVLPLVFFSLFWAIVPTGIGIALLVFTCCYTILLLYSGCTQISNLSEAQAALVVPIMLLVGGGLAYRIFTAVL